MTNWATQRQRDHHAHGRARRLLPSNARMMETGVVVRPFTAASMRLDGGHPALDLVNTIYGQQDGPVEADVLATPEDLVTFSRRVGLAGEATPASAAALRDARALRDALDAVLRARLDGDPPPRARCVPPWPPRSSRPRAPRWPGPGRPARPSRPCIALPTRPSSCSPARQTSLACTAARPAAGCSSTAPAAPAAAGARWPTAARRRRSAATSSAAAGAARRSASEIRSYSPAGRSSRTSVWSRRTAAKWRRSRVAT